MTKPLILVIDAQTGEELTREMSVAEFAQYKTDQSDAKSEQEEKANRIVQRQAIADRLGLTADELKLLLG
jgi:hypothetical protein